MNTFEFLKYSVEQEHLALEQLFEKLSDEKIKLPLSSSEEENDTIGSRLAHIIGAEYRMATYLHQEEHDIEKFEVNSSDLADIIEKSKTSMARHMLTLDNLTEADLEKVWTYCFLGTIRGHFYFAKRKI